MRRPRPRIPARAAFAWLALVAVAAMTVGCASGGVEQMSQSRWREDMGRVTRVTLETGLDKVVRKHAIRMARTQRGGREIYYESTWETREVLASEEARGVTNARNRFVLRGRQLEATMGGASVYRVTWDLENEVTSVSADGWHPDLVPPEVVEEYRPVYSDLILEVRTGLIR